MHKLQPLVPPSPSAFGRDYAGYLAAYKLYRDFVEELRDAADIRRVTLAQAKPKPGPRAPPKKKEMTPEELAKLEQEKKARRRGKNRAKRVRRKLNKLKTAAEEAKLERTIANARKAAASAETATIRAKLEKPLAFAKAKDAEAKVKLSEKKVRVAEAKLEADALKAERQVEAERRLAPTAPGGPLAIGDVSYAQALTEGTERRATAISVFERLRRSAHRRGWVFKGDMLLKTLTNLADGEVLNLVSDTGLPRGDFDKIKLSQLFRPYGLTQYD